LHDVVSLYAAKVFGTFLFQLKKVVANVINPAHNILRNVAEGYYRRSLQE
jgi:hypothetical protein